MSRRTWSETGPAPLLQILHDGRRPRTLFLVEESYVRSSIEHHFGQERWRGWIWLPDGTRVQHDWDRRSVESMFPKTLWQPVPPPPEEDK